MRAVLAALLALAVSASASSAKVADAPDTPTFVPRAGMVYRLELVGKTQCAWNEYLAAASCPVPGSKALGLADGAAVLLTQWAAQTRPASEAPLIDDVAGTARLFHLGNVNRLDDPLGPAPTGVARSTIQGRRRRYGGGQRWCQRYRRRHHGGGGWWPRPPSPGQCHAWLDALAPRDRRWCPAPSLALTQAGGAWVLQRPAGGAADEFLIVSAGRRRCPVRLLGALDRCVNAAVGLYSEAAAATTSAATEHGRSWPGHRPPRPQPRVLVRWHFLPICVAQGGACRAGARVGCCRDVDPLLDLKCVPAADGAAATVCASPPVPPLNDAVEGGSLTPISIAVTLGAVAPDDTGGTTAGVRYRARITGSGGSPTYVLSSASRLLTFVTGLQDETGATIGDLCGASGPATWTIEGQWQNAAGRSEWVPGTPVQVQPCTTQCKALGEACSTVADCCPIAGGPSPVACVSTAGVDTVCAVAPTWGAANAGIPLEGPYLAISADVASNGGGAACALSGLQLFPTLTYTLRYSSQDDFSGVEEAVAANPTRVERRVMNDDLRICPPAGVRRIYTVTATVYNGAGEAPGSPITSADRPMCPCLDVGARCDGDLAACTTGDAAYCCSKKVVATGAGAKYCGCLPPDTPWQVDPWDECCSRCTQFSDNSKCGLGILSVTEVASDCCSGCLLAGTQSCGGSRGMAANSAALCCNEGEGLVPNKDSDTLFCGCLPGGQAFATGGNPATLCCSGAERAGEPGVCE